VGIRDAGEYTDFMQGRTAVLVFFQESLPERLCITAAVRQMSGFVIYETPSIRRREELVRFKHQILPVFDYFVDCLYSYGLTLASNNMYIHAKFPVINGGSSNAHPVHALADVACMLRLSKNLNGVRAAWIGCSNGTLRSLMEATAFFPFSLRVALPPGVDAEPLRKQAESLPSSVSFVDTPKEAVDGADYIFAGCNGEISEDDVETWRLDKTLLGLASKDARVLLSASPIDVIPVDEEIFSGPASILRRQAEYRLRVHKRMLHWVFLENRQEI
jgi:ornithine carbamoyltransferase